MSFWQFQIYCLIQHVGGSPSVYQPVNGPFNHYPIPVLSRGLTGHAGETAIFMLEIGVKCWIFITLFLMLNISTDLP